MNFLKQLLLIVIVGACVPTNLCCAAAQMSEEKPTEKRQRIEENKQEKNPSSDASSSSSSSAPTANTSTSTANELFEAIRCNDSLAVHKILARIQPIPHLLREVLLTQTRLDGNNALHIATDRGYTHIFTQIINAAQKHDTDNPGNSLLRSLLIAWNDVCRSPLMLALDPQDHEGSSPDIVKLIITTALHYDMKLKEFDHGSSILITLLTDRIFNDPIFKGEGFLNGMPLARAVAKNCPDLVKCIIDAALELIAARPNKSNNAFFDRLLQGEDLCHACESGYTGIVKQILDAAQQIPGLLEKLLKHKQELPVSGGILLTPYKNALWLASCNGHTDIVKLILDAARSNPTLLKKLLEHKYIWHDPKTITQLASSAGYPDVVKLLTDAEKWLRAPAATSSFLLRLPFRDPGCFSRGRLLPRTTPTSTTPIEEKKAIPATTTTTPAPATTTQTPEEQMLTLITKAALQFRVPTHEAASRLIAMLREYGFEATSTERRSSLKTELLAFMNIQDMLLIIQHVQVLTSLSRSLASSAATPTPTSIIPASM